MRRSEIKKDVRREVWSSYDYASDMMIAVPHIGCGVVALVTKECGHRPECVIFDDGHKRERLCNLREFIVKVAEETVMDIVRQTEEAVKDVYVKATI